MQVLQRHTYPILADIPVDRFTQKEVLERPRTDMDDETGPRSLCLKFLVLTAT